MTADSSETELYFRSQWPRMKILVISIPFSTDGTVLICKEASLLRSNPRWSVKIESYIAYFGLHFRLHIWPYGPTGVMICRWISVAGISHYHRH